MPYRVEVTPDEQGGYNAAIRELKGCVAFGETVEEAYSALEQVKRVWLETALARGWRIPVPRTAALSLSSRPARKVISRAGERST